MLSTLHFSALDSLLLSLSTLLRPLAAALLEWRQLVCREIHTGATIAGTQELCIALQNILKDQLGGIRGGQDWGFLKFFDTRKFEEIIKVVASAAYTDTGYQERSHKNLKPSAAHTNNHANSAAGQVAAALPRCRHC